MTSDPLANEVADPTTSAARLSDIAGQRPDLWPRIQSHPNTFGALVDWIAAQSGGTPRVGGQQDTGGTPAEPESDATAVHRPVPLEQATSGTMPTASTQQDTSGYDTGGVAGAGHGGPAAGYDTGGTPVAATPQLDTGGTPLLGGAPISVATPQLETGGTPLLGGAPPPGAGTLVASADEDGQDAGPKPKRAKWLFLGLAIGLVVGAAAATGLIIWVLPGVFGSVL
ncbi:MAG: hypothetical protein LBD97_03085 [Bifidobacteriaceae bacterium]|jgi:hypothetical protein|nr:hypothetical protein [Bifidobacteriaceae bacterium]